MFCNYGYVANGLKYKLLTNRLLYNDKTLYFYIFPNFPTKFSKNGGQNIATIKVTLFQT